jgi:hypothetical protein
MVINEQDANRHMRLLLQAIFALTKVVEKMHPLPDVFDVGGTYTCSIRSQEGEACPSSLHLMDEKRYELNSSTSNCTIPVLFLASLEIGEGKQTRS